MLITLAVTIILIITIMFATIKTARAIHERIKNNRIDPKQREREYFEFKKLKHQQHENQNTIN